MPSDNVLFAVSPINLIFSYYGNLNEVDFDWLQISRDKTVCDMKGSEKTSRVLNTAFWKLEYLDWVGVAERVTNS